MLRVCWLVYVVDLELIIVTSGQVFVFQVPLSSLPHWKFFTSAIFTSL